ncbi:MAG: YjbE family putative metal transport protein [Acetobacter sp.]|nr:YjbE family putative metal transport protein [Acetobacter sp.]MBO6036426.1 YjbE family putative metal transport protein [Acetobacter sp.]MBO6043902.1 YjbE family putative metal transport protein [Acetobacter sp.]MBO6086204.1 YjbE family putative metal transport protein [Acetobacter sp.]MBO6091765.1 YjbE family putative metal transport protein [Acetobacter sp.]
MLHFFEGQTLSALTAFVQVVFIDLTLAGDNAVVIGLAVRNLSSQQKQKAIMAGVSLAAIIRILLALIATRLLTIIGLTLTGGLLLLWICWRMYREIRHNTVETSFSEENIHPQQGDLKTAILRILIADISMSLDNVLAVAGAAHKQPVILVLGLALSVILMSIAATLIAGLLERYKWISWVGLLIIFGVAVKLIIQGSHEVIQKFYIL